MPGTLPHPSLVAEYVQHSAGGPLGIVALDFVERDGALLPLLIEHNFKEPLTN